MCLYLLICTNRNGKNYQRIGAQGVIIILVKKNWWMDGWMGGWKKPFEGFFPAIKRLLSMEELTSQDLE